MSRDQRNQPVRGAVSWHVTTDELNCLKQGCWATMLEKSFKEALVGLKSYFSQCVFQYVRLLVPAETKRKTKGSVV